MYFANDILRRVIIRLRPYDITAIIIIRYAKKPAVSATSREILTSTLILYQTLCCIIGVSRINNIFRFKDFDLKISIPNVDYLFSISSEYAGTYINLYFI